MDRPWAAELRPFDRLKLVFWRVNFPNTPNRDLVSQREDVRVVSVVGIVRVE